MLNKKSKTLSILKNENSSPGAPIRSQYIIVNRRVEDNIPFSAGSTTLISSTNKPWNLTCWNPMSVCACVS